MKLVYVNAIGQTDASNRAQTLGCDVIAPPGTLNPDEGNAVTSLPCVLVKTDQGVTAVAEPTDTASLAVVVGPLVAAEGAGRTAQLIRTANTVGLRAAASNALAANVAYLAIVAPTAAQAITQVGALTRQVDALGRIVLGLVDDTSGT